MPGLIDSGPNQDGGHPTIPSPKNFAAVEVRPSGEGRGFGVFARQSFPSKYKIISEKPLMSCVHHLQPPYESSAVEEWNSYEEYRRANLAEAFHPLKDMPSGDKLKSEHRAKLRRFIVDYGFSHPVQDKALIYALGSNINHACTSCANAEQWIDSTDDNSINVRLMKSISKDKELFINYNRRNLKFSCAICGPKSSREQFRSAWKKVRTKVMGNGVENKSLS